MMQKQTNPYLLGVLIDQAFADAKSALLHLVLLVVEQAVVSPKMIGHSSHGHLHPAVLVDMESAKLMSSRIFQKPSTFFGQICDQL